MRKFKRILITGIHGSGGSFLAGHILKKKISAKIFGIYNNQSDQNIKDIKKYIKTYKCNLCDFKKTKNIISLIKPDLIFHLASNADVRLSFDQPRNIILNNNNSTINLLESVRLSKLIKPVVIMCSTSEVYGEVKKKDLPINENNYINPNNPYAVSKTFQDLLAQNYFKNFGLKIIITRMFTYLNPKRTNLFASNWANQVAKIERGELKFLKHGNLDTTRTIVDIDDAMEAYWLAATKGKIGQIYNIGGNKSIKLKNFLKLLTQHSTSKIKTKIDKNLLRKSDITLQIPSSKKFFKDTGWKPKNNFNESILDLLNYFRKND